MKRKFGMTPEQVAVLATQVAGAVASGDTDERLWDWYAFIKKCRIETHKDQYAKEQCA